MMFVPAAPAPAMILRSALESRVRVPADSAAVVTDPVCGMDVAPATATVTAEHARQTVYFCGPGCRDAFLADPAQFAVERSHR